MTSPRVKTARALNLAGEALEIDERTCRAYEDFLRLKGVELVFSGLG